jgi:serine/threonine-protein kinase PDIK1L
MQVTARHVSEDGSASLLTAEVLESDVAQQTTTKYRIVQRIGKGAHGVVFLVEHKKTKVKFALKYICCEDDAELAMALKEFDVIRKVQGHPNMILMVDMFMNWYDQVEKPSRHGSNLASRPKHLQQSTYGAIGFDPQGSFGGDEDEQPRYVCIVMEYYPQGDLKKFITSFPTDIIPEAVVVHVARQLCSLLAYLHGRQPPIVHRDLKPENVLMAENHKVVVTDFGLAHNTEKTHMSTRAGTLHYSAPECWKRHYTAAVDVWGLGCIIYAMCSRRVSPGDARVMFSDATDPHFATELRDELEARGYSNRIISIMLSMLSVDHKMRPTASDAHDML